MNFLASIQALPNQPFPSFSISNEDSVTLSIGDDCLSSSDGNPSSALVKFGEHSTEIVLTYLHQLLSSQSEPDAEVFSSVLRLISDNDKSY